MSLVATTSQSKWAKATLGQLCGQRGQNVEPGKTPEKRYELYSVPSFPGGRPEVVFGKEIGSNKQLVQPRSVLLCKINPRINRAWVVGDFTDHTKIASTEWIIFPASDAVEPEFLCYFLQQNQVRDFLAGNASGVGGSLMRVKPTTLRDFPFAYPVREEQRRIVAEIEKQFTRLEAGVAGLRRVQANLKRYRAAVLKAACEGKLTEEWRKQHSDVEPASELLKRIVADRHAKWSGKGKYKEPVRPDTTGLPSLPQGWTWATVGQLLTQSLCNGISVKGSDTPPGIRALRLSAMSDAGFDYSDVRYLPLTEADVEDIWIEEGDFFVSRGNGSLHLVGRGTSAQHPPKPTIFPDTMIRLRFAKEVRQSGWLRTIWPSRTVRSQIERKVKTTAGIYKIAQPQVEQIVVPFPPAAEQERIVAEVERRLSVVEELEAVVAANLQRATRLRQSILHRAFEGKLVSQDYEQKSDVPQDLPLAAEPPSTYGGPR